MKRRVLCMLLVLAMAVTCLAGCNRKKSVRVVIGSSSTSGDTLSGRRNGLGCKG